MTTRTAERLLPPDWQPEDGAKLRATRLRRGHTQQQVIEFLVTQGLPRRAQSAVVRWESGEPPKTTDMVEALRRYSSDQEIVAAACPARTEQANAVEADGVPADGGSFDRVVSGLTGERALSDRQANFVDALIDRLRDGPPMTPEDNAARAFVAELLGLAGP